MDVREYAVGRLALIFATLALILTACGAEPLDRSPRVTSPPSTPVFIPTPTSTLVPRLSDVEVKQALLTLTDLSSTWYNADSRAPARSDSERCDMPDPFLANPPIADATETFSSSQLGPWIAESIYQLETPEDARALMDDLRLSFGCGTWTQIVEPEPTATPAQDATEGAIATDDPNATATASPPTEVTWDVATPDELDLGQAAFLTRMISDTALPVEYELVFIQENNLIILVSHWAYEGVNSDITMSVVERALERLDVAFTGE